MNTLEKQSLTHHCKQVSTVGFFTCFGVLLICCVVFNWLWFFIACILCHFHCIDVLFMIISALFFVLVSDGTYKTGAYLPNPKPLFPDL